MIKDQRYESYECDVPNWFSETWMCFNVKSGENFDDAFTRSYAKVQWTYFEIERLKNYASSKLLSLKNETWLDENETALSSEQFISRLKISSITVDDDNSLEVTFNDGYLFFGHSIYVRIDEDFNFYDAGIQG